MARNQKEVNKKHPFRTVSKVLLIVGVVSFIGSCITFGVSAAVGVAAPLAEVGVLIGGISTIIGSAVGITGSLSMARNARSKKESYKNLQKISIADKDKSESLDLDQRVKIVKKYANANLRLCNSLGGPFVGTFRSFSDFRQYKDIENFNRIENLTLLRDVSTKQSDKKKYQKQIDKYSKKLKLAQEGLKLNGQNVWTKIYKDFVEDVAITDRRIEVRTLSSDAKDKFIAVADKMQEPTENSLGGAISLGFNGKVGAITSTYARVSNNAYLNSVRNIMFDDVINYCKENPECENKIFPMNVTMIRFNKDSRPLKDIDCVTSLKELLEKYHYYNNDRTV